MSLLPFIAVVFLQSPPDTGQPKREWTGKDGEKFSVVGVCAMKDASASCWDIDAKPDSKLTAAFNSAKMPLLNYVQFGRKNRFVVIRSENISDLFPSGLRGGFGSSSSNSVIQIGPELVAYGAAFEKQLTNGAITLTLQRPAKDGVTIPLKIGATANLGARSLRVQSFGKDETTGPNGKYLPTKNSPFMIPTLRANRVDVTASGWTMGDMGYARFLGRDRKVLSTAAFMVIQLFYGQEDRPWVAAFGTDVDLKNVSYIQVSTTESQDIRFTQIPLDPNQ